MRRGPSRPTARWSAAVFIAGMLLMWPHAAAAQDEPEDESAYRIGPVGLAGRLDLQEIGIDSNVFNSAEAPQEDFTATLVTELTARMRVGRLRMTGVSGSDFVYFQKFSDERSVNRRTEGRLDLSLGVLQPYVSGQTSQTRARVGFEIDSRSRRRSTTVRAGLGVVLTPVTSLTFSAEHFETRFQSDAEFRDVVLAEQLNREHDTVTAGVQMDVTPLTTLLLSAELERAVFDSENSRTADSIRGLARLQMDPDARLSGEIVAGYRQFKTRRADVPDYTGLVTSANVTYTMLDRAQVEASVVRNVTYSFEPEQPYYVLTGGTLSITTRLVGPVELTARGIDWTTDSSARLRQAYG